MEWLERMRMRDSGSGSGSGSGAGSGAFSSMWRSAAGQNAAGGDWRIED